MRCANWSRIEVATSKRISTNVNLHTQKPRLSSELRNAVKALHARKDFAYASAWKRRGERISVIPNLARKVDRLTSYCENGSVMREEHILDTAVDLYVYGLKYVLLLAQQDSELELALSLASRISPLSDHAENFDRLLEASPCIEERQVPINTTIARIEALFEELWPLVESGAAVHPRFKLARALADSAELLVWQVAQECPGAAQAFVQNESRMHEKSLRADGES
jgi:thymidylate synthase